MKENVKIKLLEEKAKKKIDYNYFDSEIKICNSKLADLKDEISFFTFSNVNYEAKFKSIESDYNYITDRVINLVEISDDLDDPKIKGKIYRLNSFYYKVQVYYIDLKSNYLQKTISNLENKFDLQFAQKMDETQDLTNGQYFNIASVYLGISLVSAMVAGIEFINKEYILLYYMTIGWVAIIVIGFSSILIRKFSKKSLLILFVIIMYSVVIILFGYYSFNYLEKEKQKFCLNNIMEESQSN